MKIGLTKENLKKVMKGAGLAGASAALVYLGSAIGLLSLGPFAPIIVAIISVLLNYIRKLKEENGQGIS